MWNRLRKTQEIKRFVGAVHRYQSIKSAQADIYVRVLESQGSLKPNVSVLFTTFSDFFQLIKLNTTCCHHELC